MEKLQLRQIAEAVGAVCPEDRVIESVVTDTSQVTEGSLFVAIKGERFDGHDFIPKAGCCGSLLAAGAIGCIPLSLDMTSLTVPLALPFWAAGGLWAAQLLGAKRTGKPLRCWVKKHKMSPETVFLCSFALSAVGYVLALALLRWC